MDTNMAQALKMAGGVLIAVLIMSTLTVFFRKLVPFQQQLDEIQELEQTDEFNKQYQVYNKNLMLGVDLISVINKAANNNKNYIDAYGYSVDLEKSYLIDIELISTVTMEQKLTVYDKNNYKVVNSSLSSNAQTEIKNKLNIMDDKPEGDNSLEDNYDSEIIYENLIDSTRVDGLKNEEKYVDENMYKYIIKDSVQGLKRSIKNNNINTKDEWEKATLETYAYSLNKKKFRCISVENSEQTGRIIKMTFKEVQ